MFSASPARYFSNPMSGSNPSLFLVPGANPTTFDLPFDHGIGHVVDLVQFKFFAGQFVEFQVLLHGHIDQSRDIHVGGNAPVEVSQNRFLMER